MLLIKMYICKHKEISLSWISYTYINVHIYPFIPLYVYSLCNANTDTEREQNRLNPIYKTTISCKIKVP